MKIRPLLPATLLALLALATLPACRDAACNCDAPPPAQPSAAASATARHPVRGVVMDVLPAQQALLVKHEAIPGFMAAMTMLFKVDAPTLAAAQKGHHLSGEILQRDGEWWLEHAAFSPAP
jgi:Cu/Ag efflux protein CusF